jgi:hypothetical protein
MDGNLKSVCWELIVRLDACLGAEIRDITTTVPRPTEFVEIDGDPERSITSDIIYTTTNQNYTSFDTGLIPAGIVFTVKRGLDASNKYFEWTFSINDHARYGVTWQKRERKYTVSFHDNLINEFDLPDEWDASHQIVNNITRCNIHLIYVLLLVYVVCNNSSFLELTRVHYMPDKYFCTVYFTSYTITLEIVARLNSNVNSLGFQMMRYEKIQPSPLRKRIPQEVYFNNFTEFNEFLKKN